MKAFMDKDFLLSSVFLFEQLTQQPPLSLK